MSESITYLNHGKVGARAAIDLTEADVHRLVLTADTVALDIEHICGDKPSIVRLNLECENDLTITWPEDR